MAGIVEQQRTGIEILRAYIQENRGEFIDLKNLPANHKYESCPGYTNVHASRHKYLFLDEKLLEVLGSKWVVQELKKGLHSKGYISTASLTKRGLLYVSKRSIRGRKTPYLLGIFADTKL